MVDSGIGSPVNAAETEFEKSLSGFSVAALLERGFELIGARGNSGFVRGLSSLDLARGVQ